MASNVPVSQSSSEPVEKVNLRDPSTAALLAWLIPGLGHWYQGRRSKAVLFFVCIMGTFVYGLYLGEGRVVYASWQDGDKRLPYLCQLGVGLPSMPALVQAYRFGNQNTVQAVIRRRVDGETTWADWLMAPPLVQTGELNELHKRLHRYFELGTIFTMVAGLLNVLVIFDAYSGPAIMVSDDESPPGKLGETPPVKT